MLYHPERLEGVDEALASTVRMVGQMMDVLVVCGVRTQEEQDKIYAAGKSKNKVSKHTPKPGQKGRAVDLCPLVLKDGKLVEEWDDIRVFHGMLDLVQVCAKGIDVIIRYGHTWTTNPDDKPARFDDAGHIELPG